MRNGSRTTKPDTAETTANAGALGTSSNGISSTPHSYLLPISGRVTLMAARDELRLLSHLAEPRNDDDRDEIVLSTEALSDCFGRIAEQLEEVLGNICRSDQNST